MQYIYLQPCPWNRIPSDPLLCHPDLLKHRANHRSIFLPQAIVSHAYRQIVIAPSSAHRLITIIHRCGQGQDTTNTTTTVARTSSSYSSSRFNNSTVNRSIKQPTESHRGITPINNLPTLSSRTSVRDTSLRTTPTPQPQHRTAPQTDPPEKGRVQRKSRRRPRLECRQIVICTATARLARPYTPLIRLSRQQRTHLTD